MMRIHDCTFKKFALGKGYGLFVELRLGCSCCDGQNIAQTTGFEIGKDRTIETAAQKIIKEIESGECRCNKCGVLSDISPAKLRDYDLEFFMSKLNKEFFNKLPMSPAPEKVLGICLN